MKYLMVLPLALACGLAAAETPQQLIDTYTTKAAAGTIGFRASAQRGGEFFTKKFGVSEKMPACAACHTDNPTHIGRHAVTGKEIKPLAPVANAERFTNPAKVEKWFRRNCKEVVGRECTPAEKADVIQYLAGVR
jgi:Domain of unknown function (DUF1924)